jgi:hypothetical protein
MSLLNDALKRASQSQQGHDTVRITLRPAEPAPKLHVGKGSALSVLVMLLIVGAGVFIAVALLFFGTRGKIAPQVTTTTTTTATLPPPTRIVAAAPRPVSPPARTKMVSRPARTKTVAVASHASAPAPVQALAPVPMSALKLQGITYYNGKWQAIINGATVYVGDNVDGFRVAQISQNHVSFIAPDGSRRLVPLGQ